MEKLFIYRTIIQSKYGIGSFSVFRLFSAEESIYMKNEEISADRKIFTDGHRHPLRFYQSLTIKTRRRYRKT